MGTALSSQEHIREYYGKILSSSDDLKTDTCCPADAIPQQVRDILSQLDDEILERSYGCGSPIPVAIEGCTILDLGCGTGRDAFTCAKLVGVTGHVIGVDMTTVQLDVARRHNDAQARKFGFSKPNTTFKQGYIEDLEALSVPDASVDVVISNCVINLSPDKNRVFSEIIRVLKPGGELYFSDIFADRRLPVAWRQDTVLTGECLAGAMYFEDFRRMMGELGVRDVRVVSQRTLAIGNREIAAKVGQASFASYTIRAFKIDSLEDRCEDYGQVAYYLGTIPYAPQEFVLDDHHSFLTGKPTLVCGNTAAMLQKTRFGPHFRIVGDRQTHFGLFPCDSADSQIGPGGSNSGCC